MAASEQTVELVDTKEIELFLPLMGEIDFGEAFLLSMLHWCGIGRRSRPLDYWQVFLLRSKSQIIGVSGLYRQPGMPPHVCWLGWFAIRSLEANPGRRLTGLPLGSNGHEVRASVPRK
jgi:hypothetical protein